MHPDLDHLIHLQQLESETARAQATIAAMPGELAALDERVAAGEQAVADVRARLDESQHGRREVEKELAGVQTRLSRYKDQLMAVKTNKEYQAMQHEIATAEHEVRAMEDRILERMEEMETLGAGLKAAEGALKTERAVVEAEKKKLDAARVALEKEIAEAGVRRRALVVKISPDALALYEYVAKGRPGIVVAEARDGHCAECHVRLRPQHYNEVRRNDSLIQCETCLRILYYAPPSDAGQTQAEA